MAGTTRGIPTSSSSTRSPRGCRVARSPVICDNYGTYAHPKVRDWLKRHSRFRLRFTPTSASGLNLVERWFALVTTQVIQRGSFASSASPRTKAPHRPPGPRPLGRSTGRSTPRVLVRQATSGLHLPARCGRMISGSSLQCRQAFGKLCICTAQLLDLSIARLHQHFKMLVVFLHNCVQALDRRKR